MEESKQIFVNDTCYAFKEEFDVNLTLSYENESWEEWHIIREFISNALDSVGGNTSKISIHFDNKFVTISDNGEGYPLVFAKRIGATNKKDNMNLIGNFGEGVKLSMLTCIRKNIKILLASRNWLIEPKAAVMDSQEVLLYDIYESEETISGTTVIIEANEKVLDIVNNINRYFLQFRNVNDCLFGSINEGIYPSLNEKGQLYNKGVYVKDINALYSYGVSLESLNRDRDLISYSNIANAVRNIWENVDKSELIKTLIKASTLPYKERDKLVELYYSMYPQKAGIWGLAFTELYGANALLYTDDFAEREAVALGYEVINCDYRIADILKQAGIKNDTETLTEDYEFSFTEELEQEETATLNNIYALVDLLDIEMPKSVKVFDEYVNHSDIKGLYNHNQNQVYMRKNVLAFGLEEALNVFLHEANHHISGTDDVSREFANSLTSMLTKLLLKYAENIGFESQIYITESGINLPEVFPLTASSMIANVIAFGKKLFVHTGNCTIETSLPASITEPIIISRKIKIGKNSLFLKLPIKILSIITNHDSLKCKVKLEGVINDYGY